MNELEAVSVNIHGNQEWVLFKLCPEDKAQLDRIEAMLKEVTNETLTCGVIIIANTLPKVL